MSCALITDKRPGSIVLTDDPLRAKMLVAHNLEYSTQTYEQGDILIYSGSYKGVPIALASTGFGSSAVFSCLQDVINSGTGDRANVPGCTAAENAERPAAGSLGPACLSEHIREVVFIGECTGAEAKDGLGTVILANGGSRSFLSRALAAAKHCEIPVKVRSVSQIGAMQQDAGANVSGSPVFADASAADSEGGISDEITCALYEHTRASGLEALSILTVSENTETGEKMEEHERRSRFYAAARLVFETLALQ